jgi:8-amino-3,8-dideoxy-alpha-D-manno-octulosonate transaminase
MAEAGATNYARPSTEQYFKLNPRLGAVNFLAKKSSSAAGSGKPVRSGPLPMMHPGGGYLGKEEIDAVTQVLMAKSPYRFYGPNLLNITGQFENDLKSYFGRDYALGVTSGTAALHTSIVGLGIGQGDEVIVPAYSWVACPSAVVAARATPVLADVDDSLTLDPADVERRITNRTKAIMAVHIRGTPCNLDALSKLANEYGIALLEDVAQAAGASYHGKKLGTYGKVASYSFQFNKMISAGEGGAILTDDKLVYDRCVMFHDMGTPYRSWEDKSLKFEAEPFPGVNYRMNEITAAIMREQLKKIDWIIKDIKKNKAKIKKGISDIDGITFRRLNDPAGEAGISLVFFTKKPEQAIAFKKGLRQENIWTSSGSYPAVVYDPSTNDGHVFMHWGHIFKGIDRVSRRYKQSLDLLGRAVHLDISPLLSDQDADDIVEAVHKVAKTVL